MWVGAGAQHARERAHLPVRACDDEARLLRVITAMAKPVLGDARNGALEVRLEMETPAGGIGVDHGAGVAAARRLGRAGLPALAGEGGALGQELEALGLGEQRRVLRRAGGVKAAAPSEQVLQIGPLPADGFDLGRAQLVDQEAQARTGLDGLELVEISDEVDLRSGAFRDVEDGADLAHRQHARLVDEEHGVAVNCDGSGRDLGEESREAVGVRAAFGSEIDRGVPGKGGGDHALAVLAVEVGNGAKGKRLSGACGAETHRERRVAACEVVNSVALLFADGKT